MGNENLWVHDEKSYKLLWIYQGPHLNWDRTTWVQIKPRWAVHGDVIWFLMSIRERDAAWVEEIWFCLAWHPRKFMKIFALMILFALMMVAKQARRRSATKTPKVS